MHAIHLNHKFQSYFIYPCDSSSTLSFNVRTSHSELVYLTSCKIFNTSDMAIGLIIYVLETCKCAQVLDHIKQKSEIQIFCQSVFPQLILRVAPFLQE